MESIQANPQSVTPTKETDFRQIFDTYYGNLEKEAQDAGGQVIFLLGNHEPMGLIGNMRYAKEKYPALATILRNQIQYII